MPIANILIFSAAAVFEIAGCYLVYRCFRYPEYRLVSSLAGITCLILFACTLLFEYQDGETGRTYLVYAGIYAVISLLWLCFFEKKIPTLSDIAGMTAILAGCLVIYRQMLS